MRLLLILIYRIKIFVFASSTPALESIKPPIQWVPEAVSPAAKRPGHEADHPPPYNAEVKYGETILHFLVYSHMVRDNFTFYLHQYYVF
jgi:hypothetical protein